MGRGSQGWLARATAIAAVVMAVLPGALAGRAVAATPFASDSVWNAPLSPQAPLDARSAGLVAELQHQLASTAPWINTTSYSAPIYTVPADQPTVRVQVWGTSALFTNWSDLATLQAEFAAVPLPANARPAPGTDGHLVVWQPATDSLWEFWQLRSLADGWHASWGGKITNVSANPGYFDSGFGATATGLSLLGGTIRTDELRSGHIDHALAFAIPHPLVGNVWAKPAARSDGDNPDPTAIPEGTRFRLDPKLDIASLGLPPAAQAIAEAVQRYGMILRDKGGCLCFYAEDPAGATNPYPALFSGLGADQVLARFPWSRLQAVRSTLNTDSTSSDPLLATGGPATQATAPAASGKSALAPIDSHAASVAAGLAATARAAAAKRLAALSKRLSTRRRDVVVCAAAHRPKGRSARALAGARRARAACVRARRHARAVHAAP